MRKAEIVTGPIELDVTAGKAVEIKHGLGRPVSGWLVIYQTADITFSLAGEDDNTGGSLTLTPSGTGTVRLVLLQWA